MFGILNNAVVLSEEIYFVPLPKTIFRVQYYSAILEVSLYDEIAYNELTQDGQYNGNCNFRNKIRMESGKNFFKPFFLVSPNTVFLSVGKGTLSPSCLEDLEHTASTFFHCAVGNVYHVG